MSEEKRVKTREEIPSEYKWNIEKMYRQQDTWDRDFQIVRDGAKELASYEGRLGEDAHTLLEFLDKRSDIWRTFEHLYVYARMRKDEDNTKAQYQSMCEKAQSLAAELSAALAFFAPELMKLSRETLNGFLRQEMGLHLYVHMIKNILRQKEHILPPQQENLMAQFGELTAASGAIFRMINDADMKFGLCRDEEGDMAELTHGNYISFMESRDQDVRKNAYKTLYEAYRRQKNTLASTYYYNVKTSCVTSRIRGYGSALEAALYEDDIPVEVYTNLIETVNQNLHLLHRYVGIRKKLLKLDKVHMYDMYVPLVELENQEMSYEECVELVKKGLEPLGKEYGEILAKGFGPQWKWLDVYENQGKTSGAYSFGSYDSHPFVLLNFNGKKKYAFTIAHEMGHSMNSFYTRMYQPFIYGGHSIFTAEVASTVNEILLGHYLRAHEENPREKLYLLNQQIEEFRATFFRQTMFAEFEMLTHQAVEQGEVLTAQWLCDTYGELNRKYFGDQVDYDQEISLEWARIPHFYTDFYVYQYATGYAAAIQIAERILNEGEKAVEDYLEFLKKGDSDYPIELLKIAGVDMSQKSPIEKAVSVFEGLLDEMEEALSREI